MRMHHRFGTAAATVGGTWLSPIAAALATLAAIIFLLNSPASHAATRAPAVSTAKSSLGVILVNSSGRTLYLFDKDRNGKSACTGKCASFWPPLIVRGKPSVRGAAKASLIGTTRRADGRMQVTYNHHPLYTFVKDTKKGQANGEDVDAFGAEWYAVSPAGAEVEKHASSGGASSGPSY